MNEVAVFLDLDNLAIGARQANLTVDIATVLHHIEQLTGGRIVLRRAYGDWRQTPRLMEQLTAAGFVTQATFRLNNFSKNLADMQIVVDTMETLLDGHQYTTYVLITGDRDFTPLVQTLRRRGKQVVGVGVRHTASRSLVNLCDRYIYYEEIVPTPTLSETDVEELLATALRELLASASEVRASLLKQRMTELSRGAFDSASYVDGSFRRFLARYPHLVQLKQEDTTTYVRRPQRQSAAMALHLHYRSSLKKRRLRVVPAYARFQILRDLISQLQQAQTFRWRQIIEMLSARYQDNGPQISKNLVNAVLLLARRAEVIRTLKGKSLSMAPVLLQLDGDRPFQEAVIRCDAIYLQEIMRLSEPFDLDEAALALYDNVGYARYLKVVLKRLDQLD